MYKMGMIGLLLASLWACDREQPIETRIKENPSTFCNPLNLDYRFMKNSEKLALIERISAILPLQTKLPADINYLGGISGTGMYTEKETGTAI